jgi:hypothetical protein
MTELREELKVRPEEGAVDYAERVEAVLEEHRVQTGERLTAHGTMPGEGPGEVLERMKVLKMADGIRSSRSPLPPPHHRGAQYQSARQRNPARLR